MENDINTDTIKQSQKSAQSKTSSSFLSEQESALVELPPINKKPADNKIANSNQIQIIPKQISTFAAVSLKNSAKLSKWSLKNTWNYLAKHPNHASFSILLLSILSGVWVLGAQMHGKLVKIKISQTTINSIVNSSSYTRDFSAKSANASGSRELIRSGAPKWMQKESARAVLFHARKNNLSIEHQAVLLATVEVESGFNPMARAATTTACGLFQFVKATGVSYGLSQDDCMNPWLNAEAGVAHYLDNYKTKVQAKTDHLEGIENAFKTFELSYYLHHDGAHSTNHSNDVKAVVLKGTQFLLKAHNALLLEVSEREKSPSFLERVTTKGSQFKDSLTN